MINLVDEDLTIEGKVVKTQLQDYSTIATIKFKRPSLVQQRKLIEILYCQPGRWQSKQTPGELKSLMILGQIAMRPLLFIFHQLKSRKL